MSTCEFAAQAVRMDMEKVADAPGCGHGRVAGAAVAVQSSFAILTPTLNAG